MPVSGLFIPADVSTRLFCSPRPNLLCYFDVYTNDLHSSPHMPIMAVLLLKSCSSCSQAL